MQCASQAKQKCWSRNLYFWLCIFFLLYSCQPLLTYHWDEAGIILCFEETTPSVVKDEHQPIRRKQLDESVICPWSGLKQSFLVNYINHNLKCAWMWIWNKFLEIIIFLSRAIPVKCPNKLTSLNSCVYCTCWDRIFLYMVKTSSLRIVGREKLILRLFQSRILLSLLKSKTLKVWQWQLRRDGDGPWYITADLQKWQNYNNIWLGNNILENRVKKRLHNFASLPPILPVLNWNRLMPRAYMTSLQWALVWFEKKAGVGDVMRRWGRRRIVPDFFPKHWSGYRLGVKAEHTV